ncbi:MAG: MotA/TolQ/ExbB proton channel family protein [Deltaproteobacteria bacterium]|nr:MotA/TolQ/ExbB proton channel family protein [Deltaproteobacteria bacterium]
MPDGIQTYLEHGGPTLVALIIMSVLALGIGLERITAMLTFRKRMEGAADRILQHLKEGNLTMARAVNSTMPAHPGAPLFELILSDDLARPNHVRRVQQRIVRGSRVRLWILATIGATSPFIGLFGTVLGIMDAFRRISETGTGGFQVVSGGISEALITTAAGIFVGVEAMIFFNYLQSQAGSFAAELKDATEEIVEELAVRGTEVKRGVTGTAADR